MKCGRIVLHILRIEKPWSKSEATRFCPDLALQISFQGLAPGSQTVKNMQFVNTFWNVLRVPPLNTQKEKGMELHLTISNSYSFSLCKRKSFLCENTIPSEYCRNTYAQENQISSIPKLIFHVLYASLNPCFSFSFPIFCLDFLSDFLSSQSLCATYFVPVTKWTVLLSSHPVCFRPSVLLWSLTLVAPFFPCFTKKPLIFQYPLIFQ